MVSWLCTNSCRVHEQLNRVPVITWGAFPSLKEPSLKKSPSFTIAHYRMDLYSEWLYAVLLGIILLTIRLDWPFRLIDANISRSSERYPAIDGLRGLLAF